MRTPFNSTKVFDPPIRQLTWEAKKKFEEESSLHIRVVKLSFF